MSNTENIIRIRTLLDHEILTFETGEVITQSEIHLPVLHRLKRILSQVVSENQRTVSVSMLLTKLASFRLNKKAESLALSVSAGTI